MKLFVELKNGLLPDKYAKYSEIKLGGAPSVSFPIRIEGIPDNARSLSLTFIDPDSAPLCGFEWIHWTAANIPADIAEIPENASQSRAFGMVQGATSFPGAVHCRYGGPTPPDRTHNYVLTLYALDCKLTLSEGFSLDEFDSATNGHVVDTARIVLPARS